MDMHIDTHCDHHHSHSDTVDHWVVTNDWAAPDSLNRSDKTRAPNMPKEDFIRQYVKALNGTVLNETEHPEFVRAIHSMAEQLELPYKPMIAVTDRIPLGPVWMHRFPNLAATPNEGLVFCNQAFLDMTKSTIHNQPSPELKAWFAHELAHLKYDKAGLILGHFSPILLPAAAMTALLIYDKALKHSPNDANLLETMHQNIHHIADEEQKKLDAQTPSQDAPWQPEPKVHKPLIEAGRYLAAGLVGLVGAYLLRRHISLSREFRADRVAVELSKAPEAFKKSMIEIHEAHINSARDIFKNAEALQNIKPKTIKEHLELGKMMLDISTTHAHPSLPERLAHIDKVAANMLTKASTVPAPI